METEETALKRGRLDIALASVLSDAGLRVSEAVQLRWRDVLDTDTGTGLVYVERSKTDQAGEGAYVAITPETLEVQKKLRQRNVGNLGGSAPRRRLRHRHRRCDQRQPGPAIQSRQRHHSPRRPICLCRHRRSRG